MANLYKRKLTKLFNQVDKLASKGRDNKLEYVKYIDELIGKGDYSAFQEMLYIYYQIDTYIMQDVAEVKSKTWDSICFQTKLPFLSRLSKYYKQNKIYQQSYNIYSDDLSRVSVSLSNPLSTSFSTTGLTPSVDFYKSGEFINLTVYDPNITSVQIQKSTWQTGPYGYEQPVSSKFIEDIQVSYFGNSFTEFNPSQLGIGDVFTMSFTSTKQFQPGQLVSVTYSTNYIEGVIESYNYISGDAVLNITEKYGSNTYSLWTVKYLSGPKGPTFSTNISNSFGADYWIKTFSKNESTLDYEIYNYKLTIDKSPLIGELYEVEIYTPDTKYLVQNKQYAKLIGERRFYLEAHKVGTTFSVIFDYEDPTLSIDLNLFNRYKEAIEYLLS